MATGPGSLLIDVADKATDADAVMSAVVATVRDWVGAGPVFLATADPVTGAFSGTYTYDVPADAADAFFAIEMSGTDVGSFREVARSSRGVGALFAVTDGHPERSARWREVIRPLGWGDELRVAVRGDGHVWGYMCLHRGAAERRFGDQDTSRLAKLLTPVATAFRAAAVPTAFEALDTGVVLADQDGHVVDTTGGAGGWLAELGTTIDGRLPLLLSGLCRQVASSGESVTTTITTRAGRMALVEAAQLQRAGESQVAIVLRSPTASHAVERLAAAMRLTPRETEVVVCVLRGLSTREIAEELGVSGYTVQAHLTAVFGKTGVGSRRELVSRLHG